MNIGLFVLGIAFLVIGLAMYGYTQTTEDLYFGPSMGSINKPYSSIGVVIIIAGLIVVVASFFVDAKKLSRST